MKKSPLQQETPPRAAQLAAAGPSVQPPAFQLKSSEAQAPVQREEAKSPAEIKRDKDLPSFTYPLTAEQLKNVLARRAKAEAWDDAMIEEKAIYFLTLALRLNRKNMDRSSLSTFENDVITHFPKSGPVALANVATGKAEEMSEWRQSIIKRSDEILGPKKSIKEGDLNFERYVIDKATLKSEKAKRPTYTTCIDWQPKLLKYGVAEPFKKNGTPDTKKFKLKLFYPIFFGKEGIAKAQGMGVWNPGEPNMPRTIRPKPGDVVILLNATTKADQHTCVIKSVEVLPNGKERWISSDGGQAPGDGTSTQTAKEVTRIYDPATNLIGGEKEKAPNEPVDMGKTWMAGWVNVDGIVEDTDPTATKASKEASAGKKVE